MKVIIITTINAVESLPVFRERCPDWTPIIVGDLKTPHDANRRLCKENGAIYLDPDTQMKLGFTHASAIPWNCYGRKNIGYLYALKEGAELFYITDDDNVPAEDWNRHIKVGLQKTSVITSKSGWFNCYEGADAGPAGEITPRGYANWLINDKNEYSERQGEVNVGVIAGLHLGSPDVDAATRLVKDPDVKSYPEREVVTDKGIMCPYDSQNTIIVRELMPANMLWSYPNTGWTRYDDIFAGYVGQVIAWKHGYHVRFGRPFCIQKRNPHNIVTDLAQEMSGMQYQQQYINTLLNTELKGDSVVEDIKTVVYELLDKIPALPRYYKTHVDTWVADLKSIGIR